MLKKLLGIILIFLVFIATISNAQGKLGLVGKIFSKQEAKILFGDVKSSVELKPNVLKQALLKAKDYVAFVVKNGKLSLVNEKKQVLAGEEQAITLKETMFIFSKEKVAEFISLIKNNYIDVELRESTLTVSAGDFTLEQSTPCPPICWE